MTKRRDLVRILESYGFRPDKGAGHERFKHSDGRWVMVPRHREIAEPTFKAILRQADIRLWR